MATVMAEFRAERQRTHSTNGHVPAEPRTPILVHLGRLLVLVAVLAGRWLPTWATLRATVLGLSAFGLVTVAAWGVDWRLGCAAAGVCALLIDLLGAPAKT
jgi:hypothetical protein